MKKIRKVLYFKIIALVIMAYFALNAEYLWGNNLRVPIDTKYDRFGAVVVNTLLLKESLVQELDNILHASIAKGISMHKGDVILNTAETSVIYQGYLGSGRGGTTVRVEINNRGFKKICAIKILKKQINTIEKNNIEYLSNHPCDDLPKIIAYTSSIIISEFMDGKYPYDRHDNKAIEELRGRLKELGIIIVDDYYKNFRLRLVDNTSNKKACYVDFQGIRIVQQEAIPAGNIFTTPTKVIKQNI